MLRLVGLMLLFFLISPSAWAFTNPIESNAYFYTDSKTDGNLAYELVKVDLSETGLYLEGWAYIPNTQHYYDATDLEITIGTSEISPTTSYNTYYDTSLFSKYNLTSENEYEGVRFCGDHEHNMPATSCNYNYNYISFQVTIPISKFKFGYQYEFYIYVWSKDTNIKKYTKLYSPNVEDSVVINGYTYTFSSSLDETSFKINSDSVLVRVNAGEKAPPYYDGHNYYYKAYQNYQSINKEVIDGVTYYQLSLRKTNEMHNNRKYAYPGTEFDGWVSSIFVDYLGSGNSTLTISTTADLKIDSITYPTMNQNQDATLHIKFSQIGIPIGYESAHLSVIYNGEEIYNQLHNVTKPDEVAVTIDQELISQSSSANIQVNLLPTSYYGDVTPSNNSMLIYPMFSSEETIEINNQIANHVEYQSISGFTVSPNSGPIEYHETITLDIPHPITKIEKDYHEINANFKNFYAGGYFTYDLSTTITNNYPYQVETLGTENAIFKINSQVLDPAYGDQAEFQYEKFITENKTLYTLPTSYISEDGEISTSPLGDQSEVSGLFTSLSLENGKYPFQVTMKDIGINQVDFIINSYINISGKIIGNDSNDLFYYRHISRDNPFTNHNSYWQNYDYETLIEGIDQQEYNCEIYLSANAKSKINSELSSGATSDEVKALINQLIEEGVITVKWNHI